MDRNKYANNADYKQGYDEGVKDGKEQVIEPIKFLFFKFVNVMKNKLKELDSKAEG